MFKEITAQFTVTEDTAFKKGDWKENRDYFVFEVKRFRSGCTAYGDHSGHTLEIINVPDAYKRHFDTRYVGIPREKEEWIKYWKEYIEDEYSLKVELKSYEEKLVEDKED